MRLLAGLNLRNLETNKESFAENVVVQNIIGYRQLRNTSARSAKQGPRFEAVR